MTRKEPDNGRRSGTLPDKVKIGAYTVVVRYDARMQDNRAFGMYVPRTKEILIAPDAGAEQQFGTLCHEIIEAIKEIYELDCLEKHQDVTILGEALHALLRDNRMEILPE